MCKQKRYSCRRLAEKERRIYSHSSSSSILNAQRLSFAGIGERDIYNPSIPFFHPSVGKTLLAGRSEPRENHCSEVLLFEKNDETWIPFKLWKPISMEDPFYLRLNSIPFLGGVETFPDGKGALAWQTVFYDISNLECPVCRFRGPVGMKDLRCIEYPDGHIGIFTRPQGGVAGRGSCGYLELDSFDELDADRVEKAPLISFPDSDSWEGVNHVELLPDGNLLLLGHVAWMERGDVRHYYPAVCRFDRFHWEKEPWHILFERGMLPPGPAKREDLSDVVFPGGLVPGLGSCKLFVGVSDAEAWVVEMVDDALRALFL